MNIQDNTCSWGRMFDKIMSGGFGHESFPRKVLSCLWENRAAGKWPKEKFPVFPRLLAFQKENSVGEKTRVHSNTGEARIEIRIATFQGNRIKFRKYQRR